MQHCALGRNKKAMCAHPLNLFALIPSNYSGTTAEQRAQEASSGGLDHRILQICVTKGICDLHIELI